MKLKYYLRGIGIGMIVTTMILMIAFAVHKEQPLTDDEIRARASELGMIMPEDVSAGDKLSGQKVSGPAVEEPLTGTLSEDRTDNTEKTDKTDKTDTGDASASLKDDADDVKSEEGTAKSDQPEDDTAGQPQTEVIEQVEITIVGGEYSDAVCRKLKKAGVIEDVEDFNKYLAKKGYDNLIQPGNYVIPLGADYETVAKLITDRANRKEEKKS